MSKEICCGNCKHFKFEDTEGYGYCELISTERSCEWICPNHNILKRKPRKKNIKEDVCKEANYGWTEITPDNVDELYNINEDLLMIAFKLGDKMYYQHKSLMRATLNTLAKSEGYYYYVLPELKIDGTEQI